MLRLTTLRWTKWVAPLASLVLVLGLNIAASRAEDAATAAGKATVTVTVVDAAGKPVAGATVSIATAPIKKAKRIATTQANGTAASRRPVAIETGVTGADGTYALTKIADGDFVVSARVKGTGAGKSKVTIADGKDQAVSVTLKAPKGKAAGN